MADTHQSDKALIKDVTRKAFQHGSVSIEEMRHMLQNAERRLLSQVPLQEKISASDAHARGVTASPLPKLQSTLQAEPYLTVSSGVARIDPVKSTDDKERQLADQGPSAAIGRRVQKLSDKEKKPNAGPNWFHLPRTSFTPELKRDLQLLKMRSTWDPKRHYKNDKRKPLIPEYSQVGRILEGPAEYYSSRVSKRDRKKSFVEEVLAAEQGSGRFKSKYTDIQLSKKSGRRAYYNRLKQERRKGSFKS
ncbi:MAG: hypothetical protein Q9225_000252 [Loekoesia sp. 1 TL-2023]